MKNFLVKTVAVILAACCISSAFTGCKKKCKVHDVSVWETVTPPTCTAAGVEKGVCAECLEDVEREIPVNGDLHSYADWQVTAPTETKDGSATKTCRYDSSHVLNVKLPNLNSDKYTSEITQRPSPLGDGVRTYTYEHLAGNIQFTTAISASGIKSVRDAVDVASAAESRTLVRKASGKIGMEFHRPEIKYETEEGSGSLSAENQVYSHDWEYEYGNNFTYINGKTWDNTQRWYQREEDGTVYGFAQSPVDGFFEETMSVAGAESYIDGFRFVLFYETGLGAFYGTENLLAGLYKLARLSTNEDFKESTAKDGEGNTVYKFQFGHFDRETDGLFGNVRVEFTLSPEYTVKTLNVTSTVYVNNSDLDITTGGKHDTWHLVNVNGKQVARIKDGMQDGARYIDKISITQQTHEEVGGPLMENEYKKENTSFTDYTLSFNGRELEDGDTIDIDADAQYSLEITNVVPTAAVTNAVDNFRFYYLDKDGKEQRMTYSTIDDDNVGLNVVGESSGGSTRTAKIRSKRGGKVTILIKTASTERTLYLNVARIAPSAIYPTVYKYSPAGYTPVKDASGTAHITVYAGQTLYYKADPAALEVNYTDGSCVSSVTEGDAGVCTIADGVDHSILPFVAEEGSVISTFKAKTPGDYTITLKSTKNNGITCKVKVTVTQAPSVDELLSGSYAVNLDYPIQGKAKIDFQKIDGQILATVSFNKNTTVLYCDYDAEENVLTTSVKEGGGLVGGQTEYNFSLSINEAYDIVLSHPMGEKYPDLAESKIIWRDVNEILSGMYTTELDGEDVRVTFADNGDGEVVATVRVGVVRVQCKCVYNVTEKTLTCEPFGEEVEGVTCSFSFTSTYKLILTYNGQNIELTR